MWNDQVRLPVPPLDTIAPAAANFWTTTIFTVLSAIVFVYGLHHWRRSGRPIVLLMMAGGALTSLAEPFLDVVCACWHPEINQPTAFELIGRPIPWWVVAAYTFYFGALGSLSFAAFEKGAVKRAMWLWFAVPILVDIVMEELMLAADLYHYYGNQPLIAFFKFPLWFAASNSIGEFVAVALVVLMAPHLRGWKLALVPLSMPISDIIGFSASALPTWVAINTEGVPNLLVQLAGVLTFVIATLMAYGLIALLAQDSAVRYRPVTTAERDGAIGRAQPAAA